MVGHRQTLTQRLFGRRSKGALGMTPRVRLLLEFLEKLDPDQRHEIHLICRGREPWTIEKHVIKTGFELKPTTNTK